MAGHFAAATSLFRTAIERALKAQFPEASGTLYERIKSAAAQEHFPAALIDWLNEVRFFGNAAVHDSEWEPTRDEAEQAREFANLFLTYAFTMPERAKRRA